MRTTQSTSPGKGPSPPQGRRSKQKRRAILDAAADAFLRSGYLGTSVDEIAALAGVSKQTIYKHFGDKELLFAAIVRDSLAQMGAPFFAALDRFVGESDLEMALQTLARRLVGIVIQPRLLQLRRLVIGEAGRFPELGRLYYERGHARTANALSSWFRRLSEQQLLELDDPQLAAQHFIWLVLSIPLNAAMFAAGEDIPEVELNRYADQAVRVFLAAHRGPRANARKPASD